MYSIVAFSSVSYDLICKPNHKQPGDYFPEGYDPREEIAFTEGMGGSQAGSDKDRGPALPGMENLGEDAVMMGGIEEASEIPSDMEFVMSSVPDGEIKMDVASSSSKGAELLLTVKPVCSECPRLCVACLSCTML